MSRSADGFERTVSIRIFNANGQLVKTLVHDIQTPKSGGHQVTWDGKNNDGQAVSTGVFFYRMETKGFSQTRKMVLLK
ncbi:MAG: T9SS type A sorting domain-containing protein [Gammaproteobacteria bacterium]|nr:T9SS type A sorting domain-containing protein [Gammaproteobacteria bacterium]